MAGPTIAVSPTLRQRLRAGALGGLLGGACIWAYEVVVWAGWQHLVTVAGIPSNAVGLVFGHVVRDALGPWALVLGTAIHFGFSIAWGVLFALLWPRFARRGLEATLVALPYAVVAWIVMHAAIALVSDAHPDYLDPAVVIGGFMSHFFYAVPMALYVKHDCGGARLAS